RNRRAEMNVPPSKKAKLYVQTAYTDTFIQAEAIIKKLAWTSEVIVNPSRLPESSVNIVTADAKLFIPMGDLVDFAAERKRLEKELKDNNDLLNGVKAKLSNPGFINKAPVQVVEAQKETAKRLEEKIAMIEDSLSKLP
ncbi:MAG TPA: valine--tRNA ligase, partial [Clostridiales bacterium]|nr:valine--tRNA ligase [Clostridiales bacterium]